MNESHYMFVYWIIGIFYDDIESLTLAVGIVRSFESVGSCLSFGIGAIQVTPMVNLIVAFVMFAITIPATSAVVFYVPEYPTDQSNPIEDTSSVDTPIKDGHDSAVASKIVKSGSLN
jgi:hypothetical protein